MAAQSGAVAVTVEVMTGEVVRLDREGEARAWLLGRFREMAQDIVTTWDIAQDIAANWTEGRRVSELPECQGKYPGQVFAEWVEALTPGSTSIERPGKFLLSRLLRAARIRQLAPPEYQGLQWTLYAQFPAAADERFIADTFEKAEAQPIGVSKRGLALVLGNATGMKAPYWQQVISALMFGEHDLTPQTARNIIATAQKWLQDNPNAPTRR